MIRLSGTQLVNVVKLGDNERRVLGRWHPELAGYTSAIVIVSTADVERPLTDAVRQLAQAANHRDRVDMEALVDEILARSSRPELLHEAARQAHFRARMVRDHRSYTATEIADMNRSSDRNRTKLASRWRKDRRIFSVQYEGVPVFFAFQFDDDGQPLPIVGEVLRSLQGWSDWDVAAWFVTSNGMLAQSQPIDLVGGRAEDVAEAARLAGRIRRER